MIISIKKVKSYHCVGYKVYSKENEDKKLKKLKLKLKSNTLKR